MFFDPVPETSYVSIRLVSQKTDHPPFLYSRVKTFRPILHVIDAHFHFTTPPCSVSLQLRLDETRCLLEVILDPELTGKPSPTRRPI